MNDQRIILRKRRDLGEIIQVAVDLYRQNFGQFFLIAAVVVPLGIGGAALAPEPVAPGEDFEVGGEVYAFFGIAFLEVLVTALATAAIIVALTAIDRGELPEFSSAFDAVFERIWTLLGAVLRAAFIFVLLFITIIGIPWAIQRLVRWMFVSQAVMLDNTTASAALAKSASAVEGRWWRTFGIALVIFIVARVPAGILGAVFSVAPPLIGGTISSLAEAFLLPLAVTAMTLLYLDLQVRKESDERTATDAPA